MLEQPAILTATFSLLKSLMRVVSMVKEEGSMKLNDLKSKTSCLKFRFEMKFFPFLSLSRGFSHAIAMAPSSETQTVTYDNDQLDWYRELCSFCNSWLEIFVVEHQNCGCDDGQ